jgi:hypothetical protein
MLNLDKEIIKKLNLDLSDTMSILEEFNCLNKVFFINFTNKEGAKDVNVINSRW